MRFMTESDGPSESLPSLPPRARTSLNRCNLPPIILGSLTFQRHPTALELDGVETLHRDLFERLARLDDPAEREQQFVDYMDVHFLLKHLEDAGLSASVRRDRSKADYRRLVRGWMFNPDGVEAAVIKWWVESRFGLCPRYHAGPIRSQQDEAFLVYQELRSAGLYNANALESQLDLLYVFCQYQLRAQHPGQSHVRLFRGVNHLDEHEVLESSGRQCTLILNNLSSFTAQVQRADEFGDYILTADVPLAKVAFYSGLLPRLLQGEAEYAVIGGVYDATVQHDIGAARRGRQGATSDGASKRDVDP